MCVWTAVREDTQARAQVCRPRGAGGAGLCVCLWRYCAAQGRSGVARESLVQPLRRRVQCVCRAAALRSPAPFARHEQGPLCVCVPVCVCTQPGAGRGCAACEAGGR
jgi:hypothetical protein